ncbi:MAG: prepilin peptidase [Bacteroidaceae bacterium]|nr:prepilin peptidase [Bacteroidaceae bacterium]MBR3595237.1 prepilin peptidase [Candidatus Saccharibacteria bacterium]MBR6122746.1 prepilin peptidase [Candidatus Saccharibacteria bacterium]
MNYYRVILIVFLALIGAAFGSFACCQAWRIRLKEEGKKDPGKRSVCIKCGHKLRWYENIPIISWLVQRGKCRKCGAKIGRAEILAEVLGAVGFGLVAWKFTVGADDAGVLEFIGSLNLGGMVAVLAAFIGMMILAVYDGKWGEMPVGILIYVIVMGAVYAVLSLVRGGDWLSLLGSVALLAGTYYLLYFFSKEKLVGGGDWMLCLAIGLILGKWQLALVELFLANFLGAVAMLPQKKKKMAFGPFLVVAFVVIFAFAEPLLSTLAMNL